MVAVTPKTVVTMRMNGTCPTHARTDISVRDVRMTIDEPAERGGTNQGPTPTETLMAALVGCTNVITHRVAEKHGVHIASMSVRAEAQFDRRGVQLAEEIDVPFPAVTLHIEVASDAPAEKMEAVKRDLARFCPVSKVMRQSGTEVKEVWTVRAP